MNNRIYDRLMEFKAKYPFTVGRRFKQHAGVIEKHLASEEEVLYVFYGQKNISTFDIFSTYVCVLTNRRILLATKRMLFGYFFKSITPDMFNDLKIKVRLIWGQVWIDTIKEVIKLSNIQKNALPEIEHGITEQMKRVKTGYKHVDSELYQEFLRTRQIEKSSQENQIPQINQNPQENQTHQMNQDSQDNQNL